MTQIRIRMGGPPDHPMRQPLRGRARDVFLAKGSLNCSKAAHVGAGCVWKMETSPIYGNLHGETTRFSSSGWKFGPRFWQNQWVTVATQGVFGFERGPSPVLWFETSTCQDSLDMAEKSLSTKFEDRTIPEWQRISGLVTCVVLIKQYGFVWK